MYFSLFLHILLLETFSRVKGYATLSLTLSLHCLCGFKAKCLWCASMTCASLAQQHTVVAYCSVLTDKIKD